MGPQDKVEEIVTEIKELNEEISKPHSVETLDLIKDQFYKVIDEAGPLVDDVFKNLKEEETEEEI